MSKSKLIYEYLDQGLDDTREDMLFSSLNENKEMREEFYNLIKLDKASFANFAQTTVPASATNALFATMGLELPLAENVKKDKDRTPVGFITSVGSLSLFTHFRDYVSAFLGLLIGGMLTALIFNFTNATKNNINNDKITNSISGNGISSQNNSLTNNSKKSNSSLPLLIDNDKYNDNNEELNNGNIVNDRRNNRVNINQNNQNTQNSNKIQKYLTASNSNSNSNSNLSNNLGNSSNNNSNYNLDNKFNLNNISLNQSLIEDIKSNLGGGITINLGENSENNNGNLNNSLANTDNNLSVFNLEQFNNINNIIINELGNNITIINELTEQTRDAIFKENILFIDNKVYEDAKDFNDFTIVLKGIGSSNNSYNNQIQSFSNNIRLGLLYSVANNHFVGIELGNEQFVLPTQINQLDKNYQNESTYFVGANYKFDIKELAIMKGIYPSIGTSINFATIGTIMRGNIGINLKPESRLSFGIYYEPSILFNNYRSLTENYVKNNVVFGVSYKLE